MVTMATDVHSRVLKGFLKYFRGFQGSLGISRRENSRFSGGEPGVVSVLEVSHKCIKRSLCGFREATIEFKKVFEEAEIIFKKSLESAGDKVQCVVFRGRNGK